MKGTFIRIVYWDVHERNLKYVMLDYEGKKEHLDAFVKLWEEQKRINIETGRKPEDCKTGCFGLLLLFTILTISASLAIYKCIVVMATFFFIVYPNKHILKREICGIHLAFI